MLAEEARQTRLALDCSRIESSNLESILCHVDFCFQVWQSPLRQVNEVFNLMCHALGAKRLVKVCLIVCLFFFIDCSTLTKRMNEREAKS